MISGLLYFDVQRVRCASSGGPSYQPMYSLHPSTSRYSPRGSSMTLVRIPWGESGEVVTSIAAVTRRLGSSARVVAIRLLRNASRAGVFGVSLATDHRITDALLRSRRIISCN